jgi:hypothetical protein
MKRSTPLKRKTAMPRTGRAVNEWAAARKVLKAAFEKSEITHCERCGSRYALSFAHSLPRRDIPRGSPLLYECALLCTVTSDYRPGCHNDIDLLGHEGQASLTIGERTTRQQARISEQKS